MNGENRKRKEKDKEEKNKGQGGAEDEEEQGQGNEAEGGGEDEEGQEEGNEAEGGAEGEDAGGGENEGEPQEGVPGAGYTFPHLVISGQVSRHFSNPEDLPENRDLAWSAAMSTLSWIMKKLKDSSVLQEIEDQLARDSEGLERPLNLTIHLEIQEDDLWEHVFPHSDGKITVAVTLSGEPVTLILINSSHLRNGETERVIETIIHELLHAKAGEYVHNGQPNPYPRGHDDPAFKEKLQKLLEKTK